jgi:hypothetical protein
VGVYPNGRSWDFSESGSRVVRHACANLRAECRCPGRQLRQDQFCASFRDRTARVRDPSVAVEGVFRASAASVREMREPRVTSAPGSEATNRFWACSTRVDLPLHMILGARSQRLGCLKPRRTTLATLRYSSPIAIMIIGIRDLVCRFSDDRLQASRPRFRVIGDLDNQDRPQSGRKVTNWRRTLRSILRTRRPYPTHGPDCGCG